MNRTHIEGVAQALAAERGYTFHAGAETDMAHTIRTYPAAWLAPLALHSIEGRRHGRATYDLTLHLLQSGARLTPAQRAEQQTQMERQIIDMMAAMSLDKRILAIEQLTVRPRAFALTPHGEISQTATARIVTCF